MSDRNRKIETHSEGANMTTIQQALANVMADVREVRKTERNTGQNFNFRGIDAVLNAVGPALRTHNVVVLPNVIKYTATPTTTSNGKSVMHVIVTVEYLFVGPDGDSLPAVVLGESMDYGDKAVPKAMSVAFRTALLQALALPTDDPDPDAATFERATHHNALWESLMGQVEDATTADQLRTIWTKTHDAHQKGNLSDAETQQVNDAIITKKEIL